MQVITIHEENHGFIGVAATMKAAFRFLIEHNWLTPESDLYDEATGTWYTLRSVFEAKDIEPTKENILAWAMEYASPHGRMPIGPLRLKEFPITAQNANRLTIALTTQ